MDRFGQHLQPGEHVVWQGTPDPRVLFASVDLYVVPFSLVWCGFAIFWEVGVLLSGKASAFFLLFGGVFVVLGLYFVFGRFLVKRSTRRRTAYAVTNRRAIALVGDRSVSDSPVRREAMRVRRSRDGRHLTVTLGSAGSDVNFATTGLPLMSSRGQQFGFYDVEDDGRLVQALERLRSA